MEPKKTFAHVAARLSLTLALVAIVACAVPFIGGLMMVYMPVRGIASLYALLGVVAVGSAASSFVCGWIALKNVKRFGHEGITIPGTIGLVLSGLMLMPMLYGVGEGIGDRFGKRLKRGMDSSKSESGAPQRDWSIAPREKTPVKPKNFIPVENRMDVVHDSARNILYITAGSEVLRYSLSSNHFLPPFELGGKLCGMDISPDGQTLAIADRSRAAERVWIHLVNLASGTNSRAFFSAARMEGGTYSVVVGGDNAIYTTSTFEGSGRVPFRRYDLNTQQAQEIQKINQNTMLSANGDRRFIAFAEGNSSDGHFGTYDTEKKAFALDSKTERFNWEVGISRDGALVAVPSYAATTIAGDSPRSIGDGNDGGPIAAAFHPTRDVVFFPWARSTEVRAYDTRTWKLLERIDFSDTFEHTGNHAFVNGRLRVSQDGAWLFCTVKGGVCYVRPKLNNDLATLDRR